MNRKNMQSYQMLTRTVEFAANHVGLFPKNSAAAEILATMKSGVSELSEKGSARVSAESAMRISGNARTAAREKLQGCLATADRIARLLRSDKIRFPAGRTEQALIDSGHAFAADAESMSKDFIKHGLDPEEVSAAVEALENAIRDYSNAKATRSAAIEKSAKVIEETMTAVYRFDTLVAAFLKDDAEATAAYNIARTVSRTKAHRTAVKESGAAPAPPVPPTPPAPAAHADAAVA